MGLARQTIAAIEQGRHPSSLEVAFRIADGFGKRLGKGFHWNSSRTASPDHDP